MSDTIRTIPEVLASLTAGMSAEDLADLDTASNHSYDCTCGTCLKWWAQCANDEDGEYGPFTKEEIDAKRKELGLPTGPSAELDEKWKEATATPGAPVDIGGIVVCDSCSADYSNSTAVGGFIFGSYGYCPKCAPPMLERIRQYHEQHGIKATCPDGVSFADFVRQYRGGNTKISVNKLVLPQ